MPSSSTGPRRPEMRTSSGTNAAVEHRIRVLVEAAPKLTVEQRNALAALLRPALEKAA